MTVADALGGADRDLWKSAMNEEFKSRMENCTWEFCDLPPDRKPIESKCVRKRKLEPNGSVRHKARLVVEGYLQSEGIDYGETFSPVYSSIQFYKVLVCSGGHT